MNWRGAVVKCWARRLGVDEAKPLVYPVKALLELSEPSATASLPLDQNREQPALGNELLLNVADATACVGNVATDCAKVLQHQAVWFGRHDYNDSTKREKRPPWRRGGRFAFKITICDLKRRWAVGLSVAIRHGHVSAIAYNSRVQAVAYRHWARFLLAPPKTRADMGCPTSALQLFRNPLEFTPPRRPSAAAGPGG